MKKSQLKKLIRQVIKEQATSYACVSNGVEGYLIPIPPQSNVTNAVAKMVELYGPGNYVWGITPNGLNAAIKMYSQYGCTEVAPPDFYTVFQKPSVNKWGQPVSFISEQQRLTEESECDPMYNLGAGGANGQCPNVNGSGNYGTCKIKQYSFDYECVPIGMSVANGGTGGGPITSKPNRGTPVTKPSTSKSKLNESITEEQWCFEWDNLDPSERPFWRRWCCNRGWRCCQARNPKKMHPCW